VGFEEIVEKLVVKTKSGLEALVYYIIIAAPCFSASFVPEPHRHFNW
jgi:hypothetical protein